MESELKDLRAGKYVIRNADDYVKLAKLIQLVFEPLFSAPLTKRLADCLFAQFAWEEVALRADEVERGEGPEMFEELRDRFIAFPYVTVKPVAKGVRIYPNAEWFAEIGVTIAATNQLFDVPYVDYDR